MFAPTTTQLIQEGDNVILFESFSKMTPCTVKKGGSFNCRFGLFPHDAFIGIPFGSKVYPKGKASGYLYVLRLTPEYWTAAVTHRTQILYHADNSMIVFGLQLTPGKIALESGTGSGSLTTSLARAVAPHGHIHTFEFNPKRREAAQEEFKTNGISDVVTSYYRDVCANGFPMVDGGVDAVFLDLPTPWQVVPSAKRALREEGRLCSFSPCIEQVQKMCSALAQAGFRDIRTVECLLKTYQVLSHEYPEFVCEPPHDFQDKEQLQQQQQQQQEEETGAEGLKGDVWEEGGEEEEEERKGRDTRGRKGKRKHEDSNAASTGPRKTTTKLLCRPFHEMRGHTGYLTFASAPNVEEDETTETATAATTTTTIVEEENAQGEEEEAVVISTTTMEETA